jgi:hypothetical protein
MLADLTTGPLIGVWVAMWYFLFVWFAVLCVLKRHWLWLLLGLVLAPLWIVGALLPDRRRRREELVIVDEPRL